MRREFNFAFVIYRRTRDLYIYIKNNKFFRFVLGKERKVFRENKRVKKGKILVEKGFRRRKKILYDERLKRSRLHLISTYFNSGARAEKL